MTIRLELILFFCECFALSLRYSNCVKICRILRLGLSLFLIENEYRQIKLWIATNRSQDSKNPVYHISTRTARYPPTQIPTPAPNLDLGWSPNPPLTQAQVPATFWPPQSPFLTPIHLRLLFLRLIPTPTTTIPHKYNQDQLGLWPQMISNGSSISPRVFSFRARLHLLKRGIDWDCILDLGVYRRRSLRSWRESWKVWWLVTGMYYSRPSVGSCKKDVNDLLIFVFLDSEQQ